MKLPALKRFGQNFLVDRNAIRRIVETLAPTPGEAVLEIGPGRGALTEPLIAAAGKIAAVELDHGLAELLRERFGDRLLLQEQDVLELSLAGLRREIASTPAGRLVIAGNLPYNLSKPIAMKLIAEREQVDRAVLMFQREVAERLTARPGSRAYGPLSVLAGETYEIRSVFHLGGAAFRPRPRVASTVTAWTPRPAGALGHEDEQRLKKCLRICFARRRQTLRNNLLGAIGDSGRVDSLLHDAELDGGLRAESLDGLEFRRLAQLLP